MSGHRRAAGKPTRVNARIARFRAILATAPTIEAQLAAAFDWWRVAHRAQPDRITSLAERLAGEALAADRSTP